MNKRKFWLWFMLAAIVLVLVLAASRAAQGPTPLDKPQLVAFVATPLYSANGELLSLQVTAKFKVTMLMPDGKSPRPYIRSVDFDLVQQAGQTVVLGNEIVEFGDIGADIIGVAEFAWRLNFPDRLPVRRKALRTQPAP